MTIASKEQLLELIAQNKKVTEIAEVFNVVPQTVYGWFKDYHIKYTHQNTKHTDAEIKKIQRMLNDGYTVVEVAMRMGMTYNTVRWIMKAHDLHVSSVNVRRAVDKVNSIRRQYMEEHLSIDQIARIWGATEYDMKLYMQSHHILPSTHINIPMNKKTRDEVVAGFNMESWFRICTQCGKKFTMLSEDYAYKIKPKGERLKYFCSWSCIQKYRRGE